MKIFNKINKSEIVNILIILIVTLLSFWEITFGKYSLKWDFLDISYPWRYFISESIRNFELPLWNPFQNLGFAQYSDAQTWYPVTLIISILTGYNIYTANYEFTFHLFVAGLGMYYFSKHFITNKNISLLVAISYMLSGFFISNAQHFGWIVSATWIPWIIWSYFNVIKTKNITYILFFVLSLFMLISGGYIAYFINIAYFLLFCFLYHIIKNLIQKKYSEIFSLTKANVIILILFLIISSGVIYSIAEVQQLVHRGAGVTLERALIGSFSVEGLLTFFFPFATYYRTDNFWNADLALVNIYIGLFTIIILLFSVFRFRKIKEFLLLFIGLLALTASLGSITPVREFLYNYVPLFNFFRFPSLFRVFTVICFTILSGISLQNISENLKSIKLLNIFIGFIVVLYLILIIFLKIENTEINYNTSSIYEYLNQINLKQTILIQSVIQLFLLISFLIVFYVLKYMRRVNIDNKLYIILIVTFGIVDIFIAAKLNSPLSVYGNDSLKKAIYTEVKKQPEGFPIPDLNINIVDITDVGNINILWRNLNIFYKKTSCRGRNPYQYKNFILLEESEYYKDILNNPLVYIAQNFYSYTENIDSVFFEQNKNNIAFLDSIPENIIKNDSIIYNIEITDYSANKIETEVTANKNSILVFVQNFVPGWKAYVNEKEVEIFYVNYSLCGINIPQGTNKVEFKFQPKIVIILFFVSEISFFILLIFTIILFIRKLVHNKEGH